MLFKMLSFVPTKVWLIYIIYNVCITVYRPVLVYTCLQLTLKVEQRKLFFKNFFFIITHDLVFLLRVRIHVLTPWSPHPHPTASIKWLLDILCKWSTEQSIQCLYFLLHSLQHQHHFPLQIFSLDSCVVWMLCVGIGRLSDQFSLDWQV